jgi:hypothetical protein
MPSKGVQKLPTMEELEMAGVKLARNRETAKRRKLAIARKYMALAEAPGEVRAGRQQELEALTKAKGLSLSEGGELDYLRGKGKRPWRS